MLICLPLDIFFAMRQIHILLLLLLLARGSVYAQLGFGPEIGVGMSTMRFTPPQDPIIYPFASEKPVASGKIGCLGDVPLSKHMYFQFGVFVSRKGGVRDFSYYKNDSFNEYINQTLYINYFDVPVNVIFKSGHQDRGRFMFGLGAVPSYIIGGRNKLKDHQVFNDTLTVTSDDVKIAVGKTLSGFDIGLNITAGYELPTGLFFRVYYTTGVRDLGLGTEIDKNRMWGISAGYLFGKGRNVNKDAEGLIDKSTD